MALKFRRGTTAQKSGSLAFGEPYVNTTLGTLQIGLDNGDVTLASLTGIGLVSGSSQVSYVGLSNIPSGIISSSTQIDTLFNIDGLISGSSQITISDTTGYSTFSSSVATTITTEKGRIDAILSAADADKDTFAEIVTLINSVDTTNDNAFASFYTASVNRLNNIEAVSSSYETKGNGIVSGSSQVSYVGLSNIPAGIISSSTQIDSLFNLDGVISGSSQVQLGSTSGNIALATQTTGDYVASLVAGTGVTITNNSGENATPTIAIGQSVATNATPTFGNLTISGTITATGDITAYYTSDKRHKNNIQIIPNALQKVSKLNGVTWEWNDDVNEVTKSTPKTGLIAQEVQEVLPEVVVERENGFLGLDYSKMMGLMVEAIKEQQQQIHNLTLEIENLKKKNGL